MRAIVFSPALSEINSLMSNSVTASRKLAVRVVVWQVGVALLASAVAWLWGIGMAAAALFGGAVVFVPTAYFALAVLIRGSTVMPHKAPAVFYRAEVIKLFLMALGFVLGTLWFGDRFVALILTAVACLAVNWIMLATSRNM